MPDLLQRVLLIDNFEPWREWLRWKLASTQFQVAGEAVDGLQGIEKARQLKPDLVLLDIGLPDLSGVEVAERIEKLQLGCKVIFITTHNDPAIEQAAFAAGAKAYLTKMEAITDLLPALMAASNGHQR